MIFSRDNQHLSTIFLGGIVLKNLFSKKALNSLSQTPEPAKREKVLGYFIGPCLVYTVYSGVAGNYLTQFYTDVLGLAGGVITAMPIVSRFLSAIVSLFLGRLIDKTRTAQGKARPWIFFSGILITLCGIGLYAVPKASYTVQIAWVVISYNLFFSLAFSIYSLSHSMMVPLSTRDTRQRDSLAMATSTATSMIPGALSMVIMPLLVRHLGVGASAHSSWLTVMSCLSVVALPATLIEYYFTYERVTAGQAPEDRKEQVSFARQVKACLQDRYWVMIIAFTFLSHLATNLSHSSMLYYCNWVLESSIAEGAGKQIFLNVVGQGPMGYGIVILWPLVRKFGKQRVTIVGFSIAAVSSMVVLLSPNNFIVLLVALMVKSFGSLPSFVMVSYLAEALDHIELTNGFRADGFSASVTSIAQTAVTGVSQTILLAGINAFGYIVPKSAEQIITQPESVRNFFNFCFAGMPIISFFAGVIIMCFYKIERSSKS